MNHIEPANEEEPYKRTENNLSKITFSSYTENSP